ncbi:ABC transporter permease [Ructibacterium gallinarum]|nr:ABC transporter permease [Ructibacterium gallinarum]
MSLKKSFLLALSNILYDKMRSLLTMLGIIIGVAAVIILISLMNGMTKMMTDQFAEIGTSTITVMVQNRGGSRTIDPDTFYQFRDEHTDLVNWVTPTVTVSQATVKTASSSDSISTSVTGINEEYADIKKLELTEGRFLQYMDVEQKQKVCVIGSYIQKEFFGSASALNQLIKINGNSFKIVGILEEKEDSESGSGDEVIYIPYTTAINYAQTDFISSYTLNAVSDDKVDAAMAQINTMLLQKVGDSDYYQVNSMKQIMDMANQLTGTMKTLLVCIAGISLLVGGIGIMNIMLVSVTERTREIGIRKSLGAKGKDIMSQFVIEAGTISGVGGVLGIIAGSVLSLTFGKMLGLTAYPSLGAIAIAFGVSVGIGILFGYLPAKNAARLNPIDALRHE